MTMEVEVDEEPQQRTKNALLKQQLLKFYFKDNKPEVIFGSLMPILKSESKISLRLLDFTCSIYLKTHNIYVSNILLYEQYRLELKCYSKKHFDPFNRTTTLSEQQDQITYQDVSISLAQLNFFRFLIEYDIIAFVEANYDSIFNEMKRVNTQRRQNRKFLPVNVKSPAYITEKTCKSCTKINARVVVDFKWLAQDYDYLYMQ